MRVSSTSSSSSTTGSSPRSRRGETTASTSSASCRGTSSMGLLDRALGLVEQIAPEWGLRREHARQRTAMIRNQGYSMHGASRFTKSMAGWVTARGGPDADITLNLDLLRQRSRDLCMGEPLAGGALKTIRTNEVGAGLRLN